MKSISVLLQKTARKMDYIVFQGYKQQLFFKVAVYVDV
jgi:hypothetical protein